MSVADFLSAQGILIPKETFVSLQQLKRLRSDVDTKMREIRKQVGIEEENELEKLESQVDALEPQMRIYEARAKERKEKETAQMLENIRLETERNRKEKDLISITETPAIIIDELDRGISGDHEESHREAGTKDTLTLPITAESDLEAEEQVKNVNLAIKSLETVRDELNAADAKTVEGLSWDVESAKLPRDMQKKHPADSFPFEDITVSQRTIDFVRHLLNTHDLPDEHLIRFRQHLLTLYMAMTIPKTTYAKLQCWTDCVYIWWFCDHLQIPCDSLICFGHQYLQEVITSEGASQIAKVLDISGGFFGCAEPARAEEMEQCVRSAVGIVVRFEKLGESVLSEPILVHILSLLVMKTLTLIIDQLEYVDDIAEEECDILGRILKPARGIVKFLTKGSSGSVMVLPLDLPPVSMAPLSRYQAAVDLLNLSLSEIMDRFRSGVYQEADFKLPRELTHWVRRLFRESEKRSQCIREIEGYR